MREDIQFEYCKAIDQYALGLGIEGGPSPSAAISAVSLWKYAKGFPLRSVLSYLGSMERAVVRTLLTVIPYFDTSSLPQ